MKPFRSLNAAVLVTLSATVTLALAVPAQADAASGSISGTVMRHTAPAAGQTVTLYAATPTRSVKLAAAPMTDSTGSFTVSYDTSASSLPVADGAVLYLQSSGRSGVRRQMAIAGSAAAPNSPVTINERTTVASAFGLAQFLHGASAYGPSTGISNAALTVANLSEQKTGKLATVLANSPNGLSTDTLATFNTLANVVLSCTRGSSATCSKIFSAARAPGEPRPTSLVSAIAAIARTPTISPARLFSLRAKKKAWTPVLNKPPAAWLMALVYTGAGMNAPGQIAFDTSGDIWTGNNFAIPGSTSGKIVSHLNPAGQPVGSGTVTGGGIDGVGWGTAISPLDGKIWIANYGGNSVSRITGGVADGAPFPYATGISKPQGVSFAPDGTVWVANYGNSTLTTFPGGSTAQAASLAPTGISKPFTVAVDDVTGSVWVSNQSGTPTAGSVLKLNANGTSVTGSPFTASGLLSPQGLALDSAGNVWVANLNSGRVVQLKPSGQPASGSPYKGKSLFGNWGIAVDGDDKVWVAGFINPSVTVLCGRNTAACPPGSKTGQQLSPSGGFVSKGMEHQTAVQIDQSGNVWTANNWSTGAAPSDFVGGNGLVQIVGAAAPVATPMFGRPKAPGGAAG